MAMIAPVCPTREDELADAIADAAREGVALDITGGGSKSAIGAPVAARPLVMAGFTGVVDYDPAELVLTVRPGTPLSEVETLIAGQGQMLAFEPFDHGGMFGIPEKRATIGGIVAAGVAGSQRVSCGSARDHLLGFRAVSGRGEPFVAGAKVVKNVTGYDLPKLAAGSWGRLFAMTELSLKVLPRPRVRATLGIEGLAPDRAIAAMAAALGSPAEVAAAAHCPAGAHRAAPLTMLRMQGFAASVAARLAMLRELLAPYGCLETRDDADAVWADLASLRALPAWRPVWRINVPPTGGAMVVAAIERLGADWLLDWAGGLVWIGSEAGPDLIRTIAAQAGGHATLVRAPASMRAAVPAFHPLPSGTAALETRIRRAFDPLGVFETGRF